MSEPGSAYRLSALEERWRSDRSPRVFLQLADELRRAGRAARAVEVLREGLRGHPDSISGWVALGRNLLEAGDAGGAIEALERALERDAGQPVANRWLAESWIRLGDVARAEASLERARLLSLPQADAERLEEQLAELRARHGSPAGSGAAPDASAAASRPPRPFALAPPASLPALDLDHVGPGRRPWRRVEVDAAPFAPLLAAPPRPARLESALRAPGIFGASAPPAGEAAAPPEAPVESAWTLAATAPELPVEAAPPPEAPVEIAWTPAAAAPELAPELAPTPVFQPHSIGEEVERESALAGAGLEAATPMPEAVPAASATLAALYLAQGHLEEAEKEFRRVLAARPGDPEARAGLEQLTSRRRPAPSTAFPAGLTASKLHRLRGVYDRLRAARRERRARVS